MIKNKKVLVTGGAGFIGSNLCEELTKNNKVYSLDNYSTGSELNHIEGVTYYRGHTSEINIKVDIIPDIIYHLGEYSRVEQSFDEPQTVLKSNLSGTYNVLEFARRNKSKLIYAGSSTKFGDNGQTVNTSPYSWSKSVNTELVKNYGEWYKLKYAITYFYNVYGKREISHGKYATLIALFKELTNQNKPLTIVSPGTQKRNFTHIQDIVDGLIIVGEKGNGDNYGIGNSQEYSVIEIAEMFGGKIKMLPERRGNRNTATLVTEKTESLGWKAKINIEDYIDELLISLKK